MALPEIKIRHFSEPKYGKTVEQDMKLAIVSPYPPSKGTLNEYCFHLVSHFAEKDMIEKIYLVSDILPEGKKFDLKEFEGKVEAHPCWRFNAYSNRKNILRKIDELKPDAVLFNIQFLSFGDKKVPAALGLMLPKAVKKKGYKSIVLLHNILEEVDLSGAGISQNKLMNKAYNMIGTYLTKQILKADLVTVTIAKYVEVLEKKYQVDNVALTPHGSFEVPELPDFEHEKRPYSAMAFGKFGTYKKVETMIEAVETVRRRTGEEIEIVIAGSDNPNAKGYLKGIEEKYKDISGIRFTGYVAEEDVPGLFRDSTVVVFPYTATTGSSGPIHQAGSYGKAVVIPRIGDLEKLIEEEGYRGSYFEPGDTEGMAEALEKVITDSDYRRELGKANYLAAASLPMSDITDWYFLHFIS